MWLSLFFEKGQCILHVRHSDRHCNALHAGGTRFRMLETVVPQGTACAKAVARRLTRSWRSNAHWNDLEVHHVGAGARWHLWIQRNGMVMFNLSNQSTDSKVA